MTASRRTVIENILYKIGPAWHLWDADNERLIEQLDAFLADLGDESERHWEAREAATRAVWLLDRVVPKDQSSRFRDLWKRPGRIRQVAVYAWGRRLDAARRHELFDLPDELRKECDGAAQAAWCDACPPEQVESLLEWLDLREQHGWPASGPYALLTIREYCRRADRETGRVRLLRFVAEANERLDEDYAWPLYGARQCALKQLIRDAAPSFPPPEQPPPDGENPAQVIEWLDHELRQGGHGELADLCKAACVPCRGYGGVLALAPLFWIERHNPSSWEQLEESLYSVDEWAGHAFVGRLGRIVPPDRLDAWDRVLTPESLGNYPIMAFCRWLRREYRDALLPHIAHSDRDWAACAYQAYLHSSPEPVLKHRWDDCDHPLPLWQLMTLDRFLHAPSPVKPAPLCFDVQDVEADFRLYDPLNHRSF